MKMILLRPSILLGAVLLFLATPLWSAWTVREAIRNGDSHYLETAIDWPRVRATLTPTLHRIALGIPEQSDRAVQPGMWHRLKAYVGGAVVGSAIDSYVTPEGLPQLYEWRKSYRHYVSDIPDDSQQPIMARMRAAWDRLKRAELVSPTQFEIDIISKHNPDRMVHARLELRLAGWIVTGIRLAPASAPLKEPWRETVEPVKPAQQNATSPSFRTRAVAAAGTRTQR